MSCALKIERRLQNECWKNSGLDIMGVTLFEEWRWSKIWKNNIESILIKEKLKYGVAAGPSRIVPEFLEALDELEIKWLAGLFAPVCHRGRGKAAPARGWIGCGFNSLSGVVSDSHTVTTSAQVSSGFSRYTWHTEIKDSESKKERGLVVYPGANVRP